MKLSQALVELYLALIKDGVLILDFTAAPDNYNAPVLSSPVGCAYNIGLNGGAA